MSADYYQHITNSIIASIEKDPGKVTLPWHRGTFSLPYNVHTGNHYRGINVLNLWLLGERYPLSVWGTYRQWQEMGCQVRKGEKGTLIIYFSTFEREQDDGTMKDVPYIKPSAVFNCDQVDGYERPERLELPPLKRLEAVDAFVSGTGAIVREAGSQAFYDRLADAITMPKGELFFDTETSTRTESYYSVLCHELTHWTGHPTRLFREKGTRFGDEKYAFEELVAELGAAFLCAKLSITQTVRDDHAHYIANWLDALKGDKKFIFSAASQAQLAVDFLTQKGASDDDEAV